MKPLIRLLLFLPVVIALPCTLSATAEEITSKDIQLEPFIIWDIAVLPEPAYHPVPSVKSRYIGTELEIKLIIDEAGNPSQLRLGRPLASYSDVHLMTFASQMRDLVSDWKFTPAEDAQGNPIEVEAILPIRVVRNGDEPVIMAGLVLLRIGDPRS